MNLLTTAVDCKVEGHCLHEGTSNDSLYCCKCHEYIQLYEAPYPRFVRESQALIDAHPEWGVKYL